MSPRPSAAVVGSLVVGWSIAAFFLIGGIAFTVLIPEIWIGQIWIAVALVLGGVFFLVARGQARKEKLKTEGVRGIARILAADQTGVYINNQPQMKIRMRVEVPGVTPFETEKRMVVPPMAYASLASGRTQPVYVDRANPEDLVVDWDYGALLPTPTPTPPAPAPTAAEAGPAAREAVLKTLTEEGVDAAHAQAAADPSIPVQEAPVPPAADEPFDSATMLARFQKLMELKNAQLITDEEFAEHKARILGQV